MSSQGTWITGILVVLLVLSLAWLAVTPSEKCIGNDNDRTCFQVDPEGYKVQP